MSMTGIVVFSVSVWGIVNVTNPCGADRRALVPVVCFGGDQSIVTMLPMGASARLV